MILIETTQDTFRGNVESGVLLYLRTESIDYIYKLDPVDDFGFVVLSSGIRIKITSEFDDLFRKMKRQVRTEDIL